MPATKKKKKQTVVYARNRKFAPKLKSLTLIVFKMGHVWFLRRIIFSEYSESFLKIVNNDLPTVVNFVRQAFIFNF